MRGIQKQWKWSAVLLLVLMPVAAWSAPQKDAAVAPVPAQIVSAKKIFISNAGGGCSPFGRGGFSGGPDRAYDQFYGAMKTWGHYELIGSPAEAELDFEITFSCPSAEANVVKGDSLGPTYDPQLRLVIWDIKTHMILWGITQHVEPALLQGNRDKNLDRAIKELVTGVKRVVL